VHGEAADQAASGGERGLAASDLFGRLPAILNPAADGGAHGR
jgi:NAD(P)H-hydrate repair Nnr-like enzyme with NAD(P)H-hydrate dehydratase domain